MNVMVSVVGDPHGPSAALESVPAVLIRRAAVSLHHAIDGDLRHGHQFHASSQPASRRSGTWLHQQPANAPSKRRSPSSANVYASTVSNRTHGGISLRRASSIVSGFRSVASHSRASDAPGGVHQPVPHATSSTRRPTNIDGNHA